MHQMLTQLKPARIREIQQDWLERAAETQMPYPDFLRGLPQEELLAREDNQLRRRLKDAGFPFEKTMDEFDFRLRPELNRQVFLPYLCSFTSGRENERDGSSSICTRRLARCVATRRPSPAFPNGLF